MSNYMDQPGALDKREPETQPAPERKQAAEVAFDIERELAQHVGVAWNATTRRVLVRNLERWREALSSSSPVPSELPQVAGRLELTLAQFEHRGRVLIGELQRDPNFDSMLLSFLCDAVRLAREYPKPKIEALSASSPVSDWKLRAQQDAPDDGRVFLAFGENLIHPDFNPWGIVEACFDGEKFIGAVWCGSHDCWNTEPIEFTHWRPQIDSPAFSDSEASSPDAVRAIEAHLQEYALQLHSLEKSGLRTAIRLVRELSSPVVPRSGGSPFLKDVPLTDLEKLPDPDYGLAGSSPLPPQPDQDNPDTLSNICGHWFTQGGEAEFGPLPDDMLSADDVVASILRAVRSKRVAEGETRWQPISEHTPQDDVIEMLGKRGEVTRGKWGDYRIHNVPGFVLWRPLPAVPAGDKP